MVTDDAVLAVALARHRVIPAAAPTADEDALCQLLSCALFAKETPSGEPLSRDEATGLSVAGAMLSAGASPRSSKWRLPPSYLGGWNPLSVALLHGRLAEVRSMLRDCPEVMAESGAMELLLGSTPLPWLAAHPAAPAVASKQAASSAANCPQVAVLPPRKADACVRWEVFKDILQGLPQVSCRAAIASCGLRQFFEETGMQEPLDWLLREGLAAPQDLLATEVATANRRVIVDRLLEVSLDRAAHHRLDRACLATALRGYTPRPEDCRDPAGLARSLRALAAVTEDLSGCDADGATLSHVLAGCHALAFDHLTATAAQSLRAAGLPDQSTCRNRAGSTPLEAVPLPGQGRWNADTIDHCIGALTTSAHATRLAAAPAVARPRRRS